MKQEYEKNIEVIMNPGLIHITYLFFPIARKWLMLIMMDAIQG